MKTLLTIFGLAMIVGPAAACHSAQDANDSASAVEVGTGETVPELGDPLDRIGRPEITNMILTQPKDLIGKDPAKLPLLDPSDLKKDYNVSAANPFELDSAFRTKFRDHIAEAIGRYDSYDGTPNELSLEQRAALAGVLVEDVLRVDTSKGCDLHPTGESTQQQGARGYFDIERAELLDKTWTSCGGHVPNEDSIDTQFTMYARGVAWTGERISDKVNEPTKRAPAEFPYLAEALPDPQPK